MSTFRALNVESDNESEDELDISKEIQIEDALKLYQAALKYHSEGPPSFDKAAEAYKSLFDSEIFKYPESLSEFRKHELFGDTLEFDTIFQDDFDTGPSQLTSVNESAPNTLPQILHLAYKNYGQFLLERVHHRIRELGQLPQGEIDASTLAALNNFAEALDKDDVDLDLWSRTASVAALVGSRRLTRFCLEAILDGDDELVDSVLRLPNLEEGFAGQQLRELVSRLRDDLSLAQPPLSKIKKKRLSEALKKRLNPYPFAPLPCDVASANTAPAVIDRPASRIVLTPAKWDWAGVGEAILGQFMAEQSGYSVPAPGSAYGIAVPPDVAPDEASPAAEEQPVETAGTVVQTGDNSKQTQAPEISSTIEVGANSKEDEQDVIMGEQDDAGGKDKGNSATPPQPGSALVTRKRSTDSAGLPETAEGGRSRSKRIRARESVPEGIMGPDAAAEELARQMEEQLGPYAFADQCLFEIFNDIMSKLNVKGLGSPTELRDLVKGLSGDPAQDNGPVDAAKDIYESLLAGGSRTAGVFLSPDPVDLGGMSREAGLNVFLGYAKSGTSQPCTKPVLLSERLPRFAEMVNSDWLSIKEVALRWVERLLAPGSLSRPAAVKGSSSSYMQYRWAEDLKRHVVQIIVNLDEYIYEEFLDRLSRLISRILEAQSQGHAYDFSSSDVAQVDMIQTLFELHLDVYSLIKHPHSGVDQTTQTVQSDRLGRWGTMAREAMHLRTSCTSSDAFDELALRHTWASIFYMSVRHIEPQSIIQAMEELRAIFQKNGSPTIEVQNNAVMPELSVAAVDRELARISMKDFFLKVFDQDDRDPVAVIESLEPILELENESDPPEEGNAEEKENQAADSGDDSSIASFATARSSGDQDASGQPSPSSPLDDMRKFLDTTSVSLRLSLWQRLREAYELIDYTPKVVSCYLRSIETLVSEFKSSSYRDAAQAERHTKLLSRLRIIDEIVAKILLFIKDDKTAFDCLSYGHLQSSMNALCELLRILCAANIFEDNLRVGLHAPPRFEGLPGNTVHSVAGKIHDMQLRTWILQYHLLKEGIKQNAKAFPTPAEDLFEYLRHIHYATGKRCFCHAAGRTFLRMAKEELLRLDDVVDGNTRDSELSQVLYDLYGLKTFVNPGVEFQDFSSVPEILDRKAATQLLPFILQQARKINIKDLPKAELKVTIDKVHGSLGRPKPHDDLSLNRKVITSFLKSPINPLSLFNCLRGIEALSTKRIYPNMAPAASIGWNFLMGNIALNKFRSQKKLGQQPTEDLNFAQAFFLQDLEYTVDRWETWYRLAQANDSQLEEAVSWSAEKLNSHSVELLHYQRAAIHCYAMAVACAVRDADVAPQITSKVSEMFTEFGNRIYSSSRAPFNMAAFQFRDTEQKFYSGHATMVVYQNLPFSPLSDFTAWKFACALYRRAISGNPDKWWNHYMLGKCLWKRYAHPDPVDQQGNVHPIRDRPAVNDVIDAFVSAIECLPGKKERREPILEPHYKLVSIVHKLVHWNHIAPDRGEEILQATSYSANINGPTDADDWERYILAVLKSLRSADKSGWHHRMTSRAAHVIYDDSSDDPLAATAAKMEMSQQIFTKTMAVQVWKPENERPGRHFVYTTLYTRFFIQLLVQTNDRANLEQLARRVRKKPHEFLDHTKLWSELCMAYLKLLRRSGKIPEGEEEAVFKSVGQEEFQVKGPLVEQWCQTTTTTNSALEVLRDVLELKRLNNALMKATLIDDLIGDTYATLYAQIAPTLEPKPGQQAPPTAQQLPVAGLARQLDGAGEDSSRGTTPFGVFQSDQRGLHQETTARPRARNVGRREIQRRAEAAVIRPVVPIAIASPSMPIRSPSLTHPMVIIPSRPPQSSQPASDSATGGPAPERESPAAQPASKAPSPEEKEAAEDKLQVPQAQPHSGATTAPGSITNVESSARNSVIDDSDDESELSELDESEVQQIGEEAEVDDALLHPFTAHFGVGETVIVKPVFPGLKKRAADAEEEDEDDEEDEEEDGEEEAEEEGDEGEGEGEGDDEGEEEGDEDDEEDEV